MIKIHCNFTLFMIYLNLHLTHKPQFNLHLTASYTDKRKAFLLAHSDVHTRLDLASHESFESRGLAEARFSLAVLRMRTPINKYIYTVELALRSRWSRNYMCAALQRQSFSGAITCVYVHDVHIRKIIRAVYALRTSYYVAGHVMKLSCPNAALAQLARAIYRSSSYIWPVGFNDR